MTIISVYVTFPSMGQAKRISDHLLRGRLIACANFFPIKSVYWWEGKIEESQEVAALMKARGENWDAIKEHVRRLHPYKVPCIVRYDVAANGAYEEWVLAQTKG
jgi:periplasmic divalent cation tolerance protein